MQIDIFDDAIKKDVYQVFADFETSGLDYKYYDIISGCLIITRNGKEIDRITFYAKPNRPGWDKDSEKIHGISLATADGFPSAIDQATAIYKRLRAWLPPDNKYSFWGHYIMRFDYNFFKDFLERNYNKSAFEELFYQTPFSTIECLKYLVNNQLIKPVYEKAIIGIDKRPTYKLSKWCKRLKIPLIHHDAESDCLACFDIYNKCQKILGKNLFFFMR